MLEVAMAVLGSADYFEPWLCWFLLSTFKAATPIYILESCRLES
jgi:hypothetical protein